MAIARLRACVVLLIAGLIAAVTYGFAPPAQAATSCVNVPGSTPGLNLSIGGQPHRVPGVSNVVVCSDTGYVPLVGVTLDGRGNCTWGCFSVVAQGGSIDPPALTISYALDGVTKSTTVGGGDGGPGTETCLLSVGGRLAPYPTCEGVGVGIDHPNPAEGVLATVQEQIEWAEATANAAIADAIETAGGLEQYVLDNVNALGETVDGLQQYLLGWADFACTFIPPMNGWDGYNWREVHFCDDPTGWVLVVAGTAETVACATVPPANDEWGATIEFCDDPVGWTSMIAGNVVGQIVARVIAAAENIRECIGPDISDTCNIDIQLAP